MGLLIGVEHNSKCESGDLGVKTSNQKLAAHRKSKKNAMDSQMAISFGGIGFLIGLFVALPVFVADSNFRSGLESKSAEQFIKSALANPQDNFRIVQAAQVLARSNLIEQSKDLVDVALKNNPRHYNAWELKLQLEDPMKDPNSQVAKEIKNKMRELNPKIKID